MPAERLAYDGPLHVTYEYDVDCECGGTGRHERDDVACGAWVIDPAEPTPAQLASMLRACAAGEYAWEAGVELLIAHRHWLYVGGLRRLMDAYLGYRASSSVDPDLPMAHVDWAAVGNAIDERAFPASSSELAVLAIAASLASRAVAVNLREALVVLDDTNARLVAKAVAHAAGIRQEWA